MNTTMQWEVRNLLSDAVLASGEAKSVHDAREQAMKTGEWNRGKYNLTYDAVGESSALYVWDKL